MTLINISQPSYCFSFLIRRVPAEDYRVQVLYLYQSILSNGNGWFDVYGSGEMYHKTTVHDFKE